MDQKYHTNIMSGDQSIHSENLVYYLGRFAANKVNFTWFVTLILGVDASTFRLDKGACANGVRP